MKYFSTFSGAGGFDLGIEYDNRPNIWNRDTNIQTDMPNTSKRKNRFTCIGFSEIDKYASAVLKHKFPNIKNYGDIKKIDWSTVPDFDLLIGGSPCQDLSVAGKRKGLSGERSGLFAEFIRALQEKKPSYFIWENVKGALSSNGGWDFAEVQAQMAECGYELWWQVLNAKDFGVPQNRERIFVVGSRIGSPREILFERAANEEVVVANTIRTGGKGSLSKKHAWDLVQINQPKHSNDRVYSEEGISPTLNTMQGGNRQPFVAMTEKRTEEAKRIRRETKDRDFSPRRGKYLAPRTDDIGNCVTAGQSKEHLLTNGAKIRRLTPVECERLMSWPDDWTRYGNFDGEAKEISDTQRYKMCGNGVVSEVVKCIVNELLIPIR